MSKEVDTIQDFNHKKEVPEFNWEKVKGKSSGVKQFIIPGRYKYEKSGNIALCQIRGCKKAACWVTLYRKKTVFLCFGHGEEI